MRGGAEIGRWICGTACLQAAALAVVVALAMAPARAAAQSVFGCTNLAGNHYLSSVEGPDGMFFRVQPDMRNHHPMTPQTVADLARLSDALATKGTALILAPVPTKSLAMPHLLPPEAGDFGFDFSLASTVYLDNLRRLEAAGVAVADLRAPMLDAPGAPFFGTDHRLNALGAQLATRAIRDRMQQVAGMGALARHSFDTKEVGDVTVASDAHLVLQRHCVIGLPPPETKVFATTKVATADGPAGLVALVGSAHSYTPEVNFAGFLAQETGFDVIQYSVAGGGAFAAISTYLTAAEFQEARPSVLVWEYPLEENLAVHGDQPLAELIAAARGTCDIALDVSRDEQRPREIEVNLASLLPDRRYTLVVDSDGAAARLARFTWHHKSGQSRIREIARNPMQAQTGRFYMPMTGLWPEDVTQATIALDAEFGEQTEVFACVE